MEHVYQVLLQKQDDLQRVQREVLALRLVAPLLDDGEPSDGLSSEATPSEPTTTRFSDDEASERHARTPRPTAKTRAGRIPRQLRKMVTPLLGATSEMSEKVS